MRRSLLIVLFAASLLVVAALWLISEERGVAGPASGSPAEPGGGSSSEPLTDSLEAEPRRSGTAAKGVALPALHVPDYGPDLRRLSARAVFDLRDARGEPLEPAIPRTAELRRKVGEEWVSHPAALEPEKSRALCEGPGDYELEIRAGPYGTARESFSLQHGGNLQRTLALPHWRRIVRLEVQDNLGQPLARITQAPEYLYEDASEAPASFSLFSRSRRGWEAYYETDGGAYFVRVFAGLQARLKIDVEEQRYGRDAIVLESDFTGPEWSAYPIVLQPVPGLHERMDAETWVDVNPEDPGDKSLLTAPVLPPPPRLDPEDLGGMLAGRVRMIVQVDTPIPVRMESLSGYAHRAGGDIVDRTLWQTDDVWFTDVMLHPGGGTLPTSLTFTDDLLFRASVPLQPVRPVPEITPEMWGKTSFWFRARVEATPVDFEVAPPTPTLAAFARTVGIHVEGADPAAAISLGPDDSGRFRVRTGLSPGVERVGLEITFGSGGEQTFRAGASLAGGSFGWQGAAGLVLRVIGEDRAGIVGATASLGADEIRSDGDGYCLDDAVRLTPGKRYSLQISSPGHQDLRLDFEAAAGITDLGVVRLRKL